MKKQQGGLKVMAGGTMSKQTFVAMIRNLLRRQSMKWKPIRDCLEAAKRPSESHNPRLKWEYQCDHCGEWFPRKEVEVDHIKGTGGLLALIDLPNFIESLFCEIEGLRVLCTRCHDNKTFNR